MESFEINCSAITCQENIPLTDKERMEIERSFKHLKPQSLYLSLFIGIVLPCIYVAISGKIDFLSITIGGLSLFAFTYFICWLVYRRVLQKLKKDIESGKTILETVVLMANYSNDGDSMVFSGKENGSSIILSLYLVDTSRRHFNTGDKVIVEFLAHSKMAISISKADSRLNPNL
jgi:hypothetical protein